MTAQEIRTTFRNQFSQHNSSTATTAVLIEIAAQLAELNEYMHQIALDNKSS